MILRRFVFINYHFNFIRGPLKLKKEIHLNRSLWELFYFHFCGVCAFGFGFEIVKIPRRRLCRSNFPSSYLFISLFPGPINRISMPMLKCLQSIRMQLTYLLKTKTNSVSDSVQSTFVSLIVLLALATVPSNKCGLWVNVYVCCEIEMLERNYRANVGKRKHLIGRRCSLMYQTKRVKNGWLCFKEKGLHPELHFPFWYFFSSIKIHWFLLLVCKENTTNAIWILCATFFSVVFSPVEPM